MSRVRFRRFGGVRRALLLASAVCLVGGCVVTAPAPFTSPTQRRPASDPSSPEGRAAVESPSLAALGASWLVPPIAGAPPPEAMTAPGSRPVSEDSKASARFACPMHPEEVSDHAGRCSQCGMDLEAISAPEVDADAEKKP